MKFKWADMEQKSFDDNKCDIAQDTLLAYTDFNKRFVIHADASNYQFVAVIS